MLRVSSFIAVLGAICISAPSGAEQTFRPPRALDGHPSFEGNWTNATITSLQRPSRYTSLVIPPGEVERQTAEHPQVVRQRTDDELDESTPLDRFRSAGRSWVQRILDRSGHASSRASRVSTEHRGSSIPPTARSRSAKVYVSGLDEARANFDGPEGAAARRALHREQQQRRSADAELSLQQQLRVRADRRRAGDSRGDEQLRARGAHRRPASAGRGSRPCTATRSAAGRAKRW